MAKAPKAGSTRKPPAPSESHADIDEWIRRVMPDLHPVVARLDELIRDTLPVKTSMRASPSRTAAGHPSSASMPAAPAARAPTVAPTRTRSGITVHLPLPLVSNQW
jgi:hypothetical protein